MNGIPSIAIWFADRCWHAKSSVPAQGSAGGSVEVVVGAVHEWLCESEGRSPHQVPERPEQFLDLESRGERNTATRSSPCMSERTNTQRAQRAVRGLAGGGYTNDAGLGIGPGGAAVRAGHWQGIPDDPDAFHQAVKDLLGDVRHLCDRVGVDFDAANLAAAHVFFEEQSDPAGDWPIWALVTRLYQSHFSELVGGCIVNATATPTIVRVDRASTPVELPAEAPIHIRAAAVACVYAIDEMAFRIKESIADSDDSGAAKAADNVVTQQSRVLEREGWKLLGIGEISDGARGWRLVPR